jgi:hypothetical protein
MSFSGVNASGTNGAGAMGAIGSKSASSGARHQPRWSPPEPVLGYWAWETTLIRRSRDPRDRDRHSSISSLPRSGIPIGSKDCPARWHPAERRWRSTTHPPRLTVSTSAPSRSSLRQAVLSIRLLLPYP